MPITGPASYLTTVPLFLTHWEDANATLGAAGPIILAAVTVGRPADVPVATLETLFGTLSTQHSVVQQKVVLDDLARAGIRDQRTLLLAKMNMFNEKVREKLATTKWERCLRAVPPIDAGQSTFNDPLNGTLGLWEQINEEEVLGEGVPLLLRDGTTLAQMEAAVAALGPLYRTAGRAEQHLRTARETRNDLQDAIYPILRQYRVAVEGNFAADSATMESLPRLTPLPGHTPAPVNASGVWLAPQVQARLEWSASDDPALKEYQVRWSPGTEYHEDEEDLLATIPKNAPREYFTDHALTQPGAKSLFKIYVVLDTDNEKGSNTLEIERPA